MKNQIFFLALVTFGLMSCQTDPPPVNANPEVHLHEPGSMSVYNNTDTVVMEIHMTDDQELHEGFIYIHSTTDTFFSYDPHVHDLTSFELDTFWIVNGISSHTDANVTVIAEDHEGGATTVDVPIHFMP